MRALFIVRIGLNCQRVFVLWIITVEYVDDYGVPVVQYSFNDHSNLNTVKP